MHFISETRYNPNLQCDDKYYRIKESFRDLTGRVRCRIMLNVGFMTPRLRPEDVRDIAKCLTYMSEHKGEQNAPSLYELKGELENHLCRRTDDLFNITNKLVLFDLTNFYFEGRNDASEKAKFGRSKEKRSDCKLLVLALCINTEGFIRYSSILAGNTADPDSLPNMIDTLSAKTRVPKDSGDGKTLVVLDAGIATEENLEKIKSKGYNYLCVSRSRLTDYELADDMRTVTVQDSKKQSISLREVKREDGGDYYLEINSPGKAMKESSMNRKFKERFEMELTKAKDSLDKPRGKKTYEKVIERVGRAIGKYPSIAKYTNRLRPLLQGTTAKLWEKVKKTL